MCSDKIKILAFAFAISLIEAQNQIEVQFLGDSLSEEEVTQRDLCGTKYCLLDSAYLFYSATQNESVRPCDDFKEFALGTFVKYRSVNDRKFSAGFGNDVADVYDEKTRRAMAAPVNTKDTRVTKGLKEFYAKCVSSAYINKNGIREMREFASFMGLKFFPETNDHNFDLVKFMEEQPLLSVHILFHAKLIRLDQPGKSGETLRFKYFEEAFLELKLSSYRDMLYEMNQSYRNGTYADEFNRQFIEIANKQIEFYNRQQKVEASLEDDETKVLTIAELNELTSALNIDWLKVINNLLITKVGIDELIAVENVRLMTKLAEFLASVDKELIADYLVYDLLHSQSGSFIVYPNDRWTTLIFGAKKARERWHQCFGIFYFKMSPALDLLYLQRYGGDKIEEPLENFAQQTVEFALKKIKAETHWTDEVLADVTKRLQSIKFNVGNLNSNLNATVVDEIYSDVNFDSSQSYVQVLNDILKNYRRVIVEPKTSKARNLFEKRLILDYDRFKYYPSEDFMYLPLVFLHYPFYHHERSQFFNIASVSKFLFTSFHFSLGEYLKTKFNVTDFTVFEDPIEAAYEFYDDWLKGGGQELELGANRLTNRQLYWFAAAKVDFILHDRLLLENYDEGLNAAFYARKGFVEAYNCPIKVE